MEAEKEPEVNAAYLGFMMPAAERALAAGALIPCQNLPGGTIIPTDDDPSTPASYVVCASVFPYGERGWVDRYLVLGVN